MPAIPNVEAEEPSAAPLVLLGLLALAVLVVEGLVELAVVVPALDTLVDPLVPVVGELDPDPESLTAVLRQLESVPGIIVACPENA